MTHGMVSLLTDIYYCFVIFAVTIRNDKCDGIRKELMTCNIQVIIRAVPQL